jgi:hypothetical protein
MDLSTCDRGASAPSTSGLRTVQPEPDVQSESTEAGLNVSWTGLVTWLGAGLSATSLVEESER